MSIEAGSYCSALVWWARIVFECENPRQIQSASLGRPAGGVTWAVGSSDRDKSFGPETRQSLYDEESSKLNSLEGYKRPSVEPPRGEGGTRARQDAVRVHAVS